MEFLETRAFELEPSQGDRLSQILRGEVRSKYSKKVFQVQENKERRERPKLECPLCKEPHRLWNCEKLKKECAKVRTDIIKSLKICFKCLMKHQLGICEHEVGTYCGGLHNVLLCYKKENNS